MGLLSVIRKLKQREKEMRILVLGLDNAGKTTFLKRLRGDDTSQVAPTLGFNIDTLELPPFRLSFWDVGGQRSLRVFWRNYFEVRAQSVCFPPDVVRRRMASSGWWTVPTN